jgi:hypothetical protein
VTALLVVYFLIGTSEVYIDGPPTPVERVVLAVIALALPLAGFIGWRRRRPDPAVPAMVDSSPRLPLGIALARHFFDAHVAAGFARV